MRLCQWAGFSLDQFDLVGLDEVPTCKVLVPMGNLATERILGQQGILTIRGYVHAKGGSYVIPTIDPTFIQRGNSKWSAAFINDLQKAVRLASSGMPPIFKDYLLDPSPMQAYEWARTYLAYCGDHPGTRLAFDIETPGKGDEEEDADTDSDAPDRTWNIDRIGFSYRLHHALSIPWTPPYYAAIRILCESTGEKVVWNAGFDVPRIRRAGFSLNGLIHDGMIAWHILHTDLPKSLRFVATFVAPWQPAWKHLSGAQPAFYNATDADVELQAMTVIEAELRRTSMWQVYQNDVLDLEPILNHMHEKGMPVDAEIRLDRSIRLERALQQTRSNLVDCVPLAARRIAHVYKNTPKETSGLLQRPSSRSCLFCNRCGCERPSKAHYKIFKKKHNPCAGAETVLQERTVTEFYRLADFTPSRDQLGRYHSLLRRPLPTTYDSKTRTRKVSFGEKQLKELILKWPDDPLYQLILDYREIDKLAGTYCGRPVD